MERKSSREERSDELIIPILIVAEGEARLERSCSIVSVVPAHILRALSDTLLFSFSPQACARTALPFEKLSTQNPNLKFINVPNTPQTAPLFEAFQITRLPFSHIYHPEIGLAEETKCNKGIWKEFKRKVESWRDMECEVDYEMDEVGEGESYVLTREGQVLD